VVKLAGGEGERRAKERISGLNPRAVHVGFVVDSGSGEGFSPRTWVSHC
jgi:hypothetical protein